MTRQIKGSGENKHEREWIFNAHLPTSSTSLDDCRIVTAMCSGAIALKRVVESNVLMLTPFFCLDFHINQKVKGYIVRFDAYTLFSTRFIHRVES